jgi:hypothetical protein
MSDAASCCPTGPGQAGTDNVSIGRADTSSLIAPHSPRPRLGEGASLTLVSNSDMVSARV